MSFQVDIWLRGDHHATTETIQGVERPPVEWGEEEVRFVLEEMLRRMDRLKHPEGNGDRVVQLRGLSWIVNPFENGVVIAIEITLGAAVAGPFAIDQMRLESLVRRVLANSMSPIPEPGSTVH